MPYIDFLQYCLDDHKELSVSANAIDWSKLLVWAEQQAIVGVVFGGIQKADKSLGIPTDVLFKWIGYVNQIEQRDKLLNKRCVELTEFLAHRGFDTCILKGQGNARKREKKDVFFLYESGIAERQGLNKVITFLRRAKPA